MRGRNLVKSYFGSTLFNHRPSRYCSSLCRVKTVFKKSCWRQVTHDACGGISHTTLMQLQERVCHNGAGLELRELLLTAVRTCHPIRHSFQKKYTANAITSQQYPRENQTKRNNPFKVENQVACLKTASKSYPKFWREGLGQVERKTLPW